MNDRDQYKSRNYAAMVASDRHDEVRFSEIRAKLSPESTPLSKRHYREIVSTIISAIMYGKHTYTPVRLPLSGRSNDTSCSIHGSVQSLAGSHLSRHYWREPGTDLRSRT